MGAVNSFEGRHEDYAFFMEHTNEPAQGRRMLLAALEGLKPGAIRWLDFGCGCGEFLEEVLRAWDRPASEVSLHLVDVDAGALKKAERRLAGLARVMGSTGGVPEEMAFDVVASNHALYYVENLGATLTALVEGLAEDGLGIWTLGGRENQLCRLWLELFARAERPLPFFLAEEVGAWLRGREFRTGGKRWFRCSAFLIRRGTGTGLPGFFLGRGWTGLGWRRCARLWGRGTG